jgi:hypothetical protein
VELTLFVTIGGGGHEVAVHEELRFDPDALGEHELVRRLGDARFVEDDAADEDTVLVLPRGDEGLTFAVAAEDEDVVTVAYDVDLPAGGIDELDLGTVNAAAEVQFATPDGSFGDARLVAAHDRLTVDAPDDGADVPWDAIGLAVGVLAIGGWLLSLHRSRRAAPAVDVVEGPPSTQSPAEVGWLLRHGRVVPADLAATVVDLTARGFIVPFRRDDGVLVLGQGRPPTDLAPHEQLVVDWLFGDWVRQADLAAQRAAIREHPERWSDLWTAFVEQVDERGRAGALVERDVASATVLAAAAAGLVLLLAGVAGTAHGYPGWLMTILAGALVLAGATAFARRTPEGEALAAAWEAFGDRLRAGEDLTPHALAYAVTLGEEVDPAGHGPWPAQLVHEEVERHVVGWREAYLSATSVRGEPSERVRAFLSLRSLRRRAAVPVD